MRSASYFILVFASIVLLSGLMGFLQAQQLLSLYIEVSGSLILLLAFFFMLKKKKEAYWTSVATIIGLFIYFGYLFAKTTQFFPGFLAALSAFSLFLLFIELFHIGKE
ncbi:MAG: TMEM14 family protein [Parachlamydiales bacterium]|nr:TMEM14 family protein [Parachlamydiales bacterium]